MTTFLGISKHSPEKCAMFDEKSKKCASELFEKMDGLAEKHGAKMIGFWAVPSEHLTFLVIEAPTVEAFQRLGMEPEMMAMSSWCTTEWKIARTKEETNEMMKKIK